MKYFFIVFAITFMDRSAIACSFEQQPIEGLVSAAKIVFRARVTEVKLAKLGSRGRQSEVVEARYKILEVFKGTPPASGIVRDIPYGPANCSLGLFPGTEYVFFPGELGMVSLPSGSFGYFNAEDADTKVRLGAIRRATTRSKRQ